MKEQIQYKVCVRCATFNHAPYITDTMDGFCLQQTSFPFVCVIIDDCSRDGAQEVIKRYLDDHFDTESTEETADYNLILARHKENVCCHFAVFLLKCNHYSKGIFPLIYADRWNDGSQYVAMCEGDDYWIDAGKLQRQVDALDCHPNAMMVYTDFNIVDREKNSIEMPQMEPFRKRSHSGDNLPTLLQYGNYVMTLTTMYRREVWKTESFRNSPRGLDFGLTMAAALMGDFLYIPDRTACYRILSQSMVRSGVKQGVDKIQDIYRYYALLVMDGRCKSLSLGKRIKIMTFVLMRALKKKDSMLKSKMMESSLLAKLLLPLAFVRFKLERIYRIL